MAARQRKAEVVPLVAAARVEGPRVGRIAQFDRGEIRVRWGAGAPVVARVSAGLDDATLSAAAREKQEVLLLFENGDPTQPVVVALLRSATPLLDQVLARSHQIAEQPTRVDGRQVVIEGQEEIVLQCGEASLTLRRDGKVILRGLNVTTQADEVHKIRGGKVQIN
jgi:voltage-gated potassium channel Kch